MTAPSICAAPGCPNVRPCPAHPVTPGRSRGWQWSTEIVPRILDRELAVYSLGHPRGEFYGVAQRTGRAHGEGDSPDFRTAVLAALESAIGGEQ